MQGSSPRNYTLQIINYTLHITINAMRNFTVNQEGAQRPRRNRGCLWTIVVCCLLYIGLCGWLGYMMGDMFSTPATKLESASVYRLSLNGTLVEQATPANPFAELLGSTPMPFYQQENTVGLDEILSNIRLAKTDDRIEGIYLEGGALSMSPADAKTIRDALLDYKTSGKWILAYSESYGQLNYYIASVADRIYLNPTGTVDWNGLAASREYYTRILEKLGIEMQILKVGTFKSAVEPYFRTSMSDADRLQTKQYLDGIWSEMKTAVAESRHLSVEQLDAYADEYMGLQPQEKYVAYGLVDTLVYKQTMDSVLRTYTGTKDYHTLSTAKLALVPRTESKAKDKIAVVYADGGITDNSGSGIVGTDFVKMLDKIRKDDHVKAVVLRVNSPGGSADASEQIWHAIQLIREKGVPVVVSMGGYAASGGYYISCGSDYIFAEPTTLTGSIGIFGTVPNLRGLREKVGYDVDVVTTNAHADLETNVIMNGMTPEEHALLQTMIERGYDLFTRRCAEGRHTTQEAIKEIGEGRVWLGKDALAIGLVDSLGNIDNAIEKAAALAELEQYKLTYYPEPEDPMASLLSMFDTTTDEERLVMKIKEFASKPRIMALMPEVTIR